MLPTRRQAIRLTLGLAIASRAPGVLASGRPGSRRTGREPLQAPRSWHEALQTSGRTARPIVLMFSRPGCPHCVALRLESIGHLQAEAEERGVLVYELDMTDRRPFETGLPARAETADAKPAELAARPAELAATPADLAANLNVRISPTVLFLGPDGELAERLIGYSPDFYDAYLQDRIKQARAKLAGR